MTDLDLPSSYAWCERLARRQAGNFYPAFRVLPAAQRRAMCALYAFMRITDDMADEPAEVEIKRRHLKSWRGQLHEALAGHFAHPAHAAIRDSIDRYSIPPRYFEDVLDGVEMDLQPVRIGTFAELSEYCYRVASAVGLACIHIWGFSHEDAKKPAEQAGIALQLTNILRDIGEDRARGRIYLPAEDLTRFHCSPERLGCVDDPGYRELMAFEVERARGYYVSAESLSAYLSRGGRAVFQIIMATYRGVLDEIERRRYDVLSSRVSLSRWKKLRLVLRALPVRWGLSQ